MISPNYRILEAGC